MFRQTLGVTALALLTLAALPAAADSFTEAEHDAIAAEIAAFDQAFAEGDIMTVMLSVPPKVLDLLAEQAGEPLDDYIAQLTEITTDMMTQVTIEKYDIDLDGAQYLEAPSGAPYALIPTMTQIVSGGETFVVTTNTLAFCEDGDVHLARIDDPAQIDLLVAAYPQFDGIDVPVSRSEVVE